MEGLVPLLIAVGVSVALSLLKKKPAPPTESDKLPQDSPWDDLMREIQRQQPDPEPVRDEYTYDTEGESLETIEPEVTEAFPRSAAAPDAPMAPVVLPRMQTVEVPREIGSLAEEPEFVPFSYDDDAIALSAPEAEIAVAPLYAMQAGRDADKTAQDSPITAKADQDEDDALFAGGFDPRMAVIYSEVLRPKYHEY